MELIYQKMTSDIDARNKFVDLLFICDLPFDTLSSTIKTKSSLSSPALLFGFDLVYVEEHLKRLIQHIAGDPLDRNPPPRLFSDLRYQSVQLVSMFFESSPYHRHGLTPCLFFTSC